MYINVQKSLYLVKIELIVMSDLYFILVNQLDQITHRKRGEICAKLF